MAKFFKNITITIPLNGEDVHFILRRPTNEEINGFLASRWDAAKRPAAADVEAAANEARCDFFDKLLIEVKTLVDEEDKPITPERKGEIPSPWKIGGVIRLFENVPLNIKN